MPAASRREIADHIVGVCRQLGTTHAFGMPGGGSNLDVAGSCDHHGIPFVLAHSEGAAAIMASVVGELSGAPGICVATRGPGAASAVNGVAGALVDRQPMVLITDCVAAEDAPRISHQRIDQPALFAPITLASLALNGRDPEVAGAAVRLTLGAPPGPVHLDVDPSAPDPAPPSRALPADGPGRSSALPPAGPDAVLGLVSAARRPVVVLGVGVAVAAPAGRDRILAAVTAAAARANAPVLVTYKTKGLVAEDASFLAGVLTGATIEAEVLGAADLIVGVGLDPVELIPAPWPYPAPVVLVGSWPVDDGTHASSSFFGERLAAEAVGDLSDLAEAVAAAVGGEWRPGDGAAFREAARQRVLAAGAADPGPGLTPQQVVLGAAEAAPAGTVATVDAGAHMLVAMALWPGRALISSGYATMGFSLPAAIAASLSRPGEPVVCFTGDGGLTMVLGELETLARLGLPVVVVVFNDATLSLIGVKQSPEGHGGEAAVTFRRTDFAAIAEGSGLLALRAESVEEYREALGRALTSGGPALVDAAVNPAPYREIIATIRG